MDPLPTPQVSKGLATWLGVAGTALCAVVTALTPILEGNQQANTELFAKLTALFGAVTILGRMLQSAAALLGTGKERVTMERDKRDRVTRGT
jgi:CDP-diglyceride synthetase